MHFHDIILPPDSPHWYTTIAAPPLPQTNTKLYSNICLQLHFYKTKKGKYSYNSFDNKLMLFMSTSPE